MNIEVIKKNPQLIKSVRLNLSHDENDDSIDQKITNMSKEEIFEKFLVWNNIIGFGEELLFVYDTLKNSLENDLINFEHLAANEDSGIIDTIREGAGFPSFGDPNFDDQKFVDYINKLNLKQAFDKYLSWKGIKGFTSSIIDAIETLEKAKD